MPGTRKTTARKPAVRKVAAKQPEAIVEASEPTTVRVRTKRGGCIGTWFEGRHIEVTHQGVDLSPSAAKHFLTMWSRDIERVDKEKTL